MRWDETCNECGEFLRDCKCDGSKPDPILPPVDDELADRMLSASMLGWPNVEEWERYAKYVIALREQLREAKADAAAGWQQAKEEHEDFDKDLEWEWLDPWDKQWKKEPEMSFEWVAEYRVNGVPLAKVLDELALNQQEHADYGPGRINERCAFRAAVLRALVGKGEEETS